MTWPEAVYKIIAEGGGALFTAAVVLYFFTGFWESLFSILKRDELSSSSAVALRRVSDEMRGYAAGETVSVYHRQKLTTWARVIEKVACNEYDEEDD